MPYDSIDEAKKAGFPTSAEEISLTLDQINRLAEIYDAINKVGTTEIPFAVAWSQWKKEYKKQGDKWIKVKQMEQKESHEVLLQTLDRDIGGIFFTKKPFENSVEDWINTPVVFASQHPELELFDRSPEDAVAKINGRIIGNISKAWIEQTGHPRLMGTLKWDDPEASDLYKSGKLSVSTAFFANSSNHKLVGTVIPNHVLVFKEDKANLPVDKGAIILNKEPFHDMINAGKVISAANASKLKRMLDDLLSFFKEMTESNTKAYNEVQRNKDSNGVDMDMKENEELTSMLSVANKEKADALALLEVANKEKDDLIIQVKGMEDTIKAFEQKEADALKVLRDTQWEKIKEGIPVGLTHKEEDEKALRKEFDEDPHGFALKMIGMGHRAPGSEEGQEYGSMGAEGLAEVEALKSATGG